MGIRYDFSAIAESSQSLFITPDDPRTLPSNSTPGLVPLVWRTQEGQHLTPTGEALLSFGIGTRVGEEINGRNIEEFIARIRMLEGVEGLAYLTEGCRALPESTIRAALGFKINTVYTPRAEWLTKLFQVNFPACDPDDCGTREFSVTAVGLYDGRFETEVWALNEREAIKKAGRTFRSWMGEDWPLPPTREWSVTELPRS